MKALAYIAERASEPSTWAGLGSLLTGVGVYVAPDQWREIMGIGMSVGGFLAVVLRDGRNEPS